MTINLSRRGVLVAPSALFITACTATISSGAENAEIWAFSASPFCPWAALAAEREAIFQRVNASANVNGNVPDDLARDAWGRVSEIDAEIAATAPASAAGLAAVLRHLAWEINGGSSPDDPAIVAAMRAAADWVGTLPS